MLLVTKNMSYSEALRAAKQGKAIGRAGWNGKGMFVYHVDAGNYPAKSPVAKAAWGEDALVPYGEYFAIKGANGVVYPWTPSHQDQTTDDWEVIEF